MAKKTIIEIVEEYGLEVHKQGNLFRAYCPFHNDTSKPNFTIYAETDSWCCFACDIGGNAIKFISLIEHITYAEAAERFSGSLVDLEELQQQIDGLASTDNNLFFNDEANKLISKTCRYIIQTKPEMQAGVMSWLQNFDKELDQPIAYDKMQSLLQEVKQKFGTPV